MDILRRNRPQLSFPGRSEATNILDTPGKGYHRLLNWQIQTTKVSWVGQSTRFTLARIFLQRFFTKGLFINDVIIFGGYADPLVIICHFLATPPFCVMTSFMNRKASNRQFVDIYITLGPP